MELFETVGDSDVKRISSDTVVGSTPIKERSKQIPSLRTAASPTQIHLESKQIFTPLSPECKEIVQVRGRCWLILPVLC